MKIKPLIIVSAALGAIWLLLVPLLVGLYLRGAVPDWIAAWPDADLAEYKPGWFWSRLRWSSSDGIELDLRARHAPPLRAGLLRVSGFIDSPMTPEPARLRGHIGLTGGWNLEARLARFADSGSLALQAREVRLNVAQPSRQPMTLIVNAEQLGQHGHAESDTLGPARLMARQHRDESGRHYLGLDLRLGSSALGQAALSLSAGPADPELLNALIESLIQWSGSEPDSLSQRLALLSAVGAWQQLGAEGLVIRVERLELGEHTRIFARWATQRPMPDIEGAGRSAELAAWSAVLAALAGQPTEQTEQVVQAWLLTLAQHGWIRLEEDRFEITLPAGR